MWLDSQEVTLFRSCRGGGESVARTTRMNQRRAYRWCVRSFELITKPVAQYGVSPGHGQSSTSSMGETIYTMCTSRVA